MNDTMTDDQILDAYGGEVLDDSNYGDPDVEEAYEDVVGIDDEAVH